MTALEHYIIMRDMMDLGVKTHLLDVPDALYDISQQHITLQNLSVRLKTQSVDVPEREAVYHSFKPFIPPSFIPEPVKTKRLLQPALSRNTGQGAGIQAVSEQDERKPFKFQPKPADTTDKIIVPSALHDKIQQARLRAAGSDTVQNLIQAVHHFETDTQLQHLSMGTVFFDGDEGADILVIGHLPDKHDEEMQKPFSGTAGQMMRDAIKYASVYRDIPPKIAYMNIVPWRAVTHTIPADFYILCIPFVMRMIALMNPKKIIISGALASQYVLDTQKTLLSMRGLVHDFTILDKNYQALVTFHPIHLMGNGAAKKFFWQDILTYLSDDVISNHLNIQE